MTLAVKWAYRHHRLTFDHYDTLEEAVSSAMWMSDQGEEAFVAIEVWGDDGTYRFIDRNEGFELVSAMSKARDAKEEERAIERPPMIAELWIDPAMEGEKPVLWSGFRDEAGLQRALTDLALMGGRVTVKRGREMKQCAHCSGYGPLFDHVKECRCCDHCTHHRSEGGEWDHLHSSDGSREEG